MKIKLIFLNALAMALLASAEYTYDGPPQSPESKITQNTHRSLPECKDNLVVSAGFVIGYQKEKEKSKEKSKEKNKNKEDIVASAGFVLG